MYNNCCCPSCYCKKGSVFFSPFGNLNSYFQVLFPQLPELPQFYIDIELTNVPL